MNCQVNRKKLWAFVLVSLIAVAAGIVGFEINNVLGTGTAVTVTPSNVALWNSDGTLYQNGCSVSFQDSYNFLVFIEGGVVYVKTGSSGNVSAGTIQACLDSLNNTGGSVIVKNGTYTEVVTLRNYTRLVLDRGAVGVTFSCGPSATAILEDYNLAITYVYSVGVLVMQYNNVNGAVNGIYSTFTNFYGTNYYLGGSALGFVAFLVY